VRWMVGTDAIKGADALAGQATGLDSLSTPRAPTSPTSLERLPSGPRRDPRIPASPFWELSSCHLEQALARVDLMWNGSVKRVVRSLRSSFWPRRTKGSVLIRFFEQATGSPVSRQERPQRSEDVGPAS